MPNTNSSGNSTELIPELNIYACNEFVTIAAKNKTIYIVVHNNKQ